jgi:hypothetical protein
VPVQRVTKYPLLLSRLYKVTPSHHTDKNDIKSAQDKIEAALEQMNKVSFKFFFSEFEKSLIFRVLFYFYPWIKNSFPSIFIYLRQKALLLSRYVRKKFF